MQADYLLRSWVNKEIGGLINVITHGRNIKIFTGNSNPELAHEIAQRLNIPMGNSEVSTFSDGEISVNIYETEG